MSHLIAGMLEFWSFCALFLHSDEFRKKKVFFFYIADSFWRFLECLRSCQTEVSDYSLIKEMFLLALGHNLFVV